MNKQLKRELSWFGATIMGLGSVIGAGIFVSLGIAAGISGSTVIVALVIAGFLSGCNSINLAQLAANHPVSGGIYEYGYRYLTPWLGFTGGWLYLVGKVAVAATAALGFAGYLLNTLGIQNQAFVVPCAEVAVLILTLIVLGGMRRSKVTTIVIVAVTITTLMFFVVGGLFFLSTKGFAPLSLETNNNHSWLRNLLESVAFLFVAYNGAGRISMLGEEVKEPRTNIPKAITITLVITMLLYIAVALVSLGSIGAEALSIAATVEAAPLEVVAEHFGIPGAKSILAIGAIAATLSVLLNIILGLSRLLLAMGRRRDMPSFITQLNKSQTTPYWAVICTGVAIALLVLIGDVKTTWSFAAFGALSRGVIASLATLSLSNEERLYPLWLTWLVLFSCLFLAFWVDWQIWLIGLALVGIGQIWHFTAQQINSTGNLELEREIGNG